MKKLAIISTIILGLATASCDSYLDINQDPNSPTEENMNTSILLPAAEMGIAATYGNLLRIPAGYFAQHYSHMFGTSNYVDFSQFEMSPVRSGSAYSQINRVGLKNLQTIRMTATAASRIQRRSTSATHHPNMMMVPRCTPVSFRNSMRH